MGFYRIVEKWLPGTPLSYPRFPLPLGMPFPSAGSLYNFLSSGVEIGRAPRSVLPF